VNRHDTAWEGHRISHPVAGGDACLDLVIDDAILHELASKQAVREGQQQWQCAITTGSPSLSYLQARRGVCLSAFASLPLDRRWRKVTAAVAAAQFASGGGKIWQANQTMDHGRVIHGKSKASCQQGQPLFCAVPI
jgi:hypothetical protein